MATPPLFLIRLSFWPSITFNRLMCGLGIWNHWDWVDPTLLLGAMPARKHIRELHDLGIRAIVNLCEEFSGHTAEMAACGVTQLHLPTLDYTCPGADVLTRGVRFLMGQAAAGRKSFVHCKAGQGRSATLALCYLMAAHSLTASEAYAQLRAARCHVNRRLDRRKPVRAFGSLLADGGLRIPQ